MRFRVWLLLLLLPIAAQSADIRVLPERSDKAAVFSLVANERPAPIVVAKEAPQVMQIAVRDFARDVERVTGARPDIVHRPPEGSPYVHVSISPELEGQWEAFRLSARTDVLSVEGADPRGVVYGIYELSRRIGVSPWYWWADVPVNKRDALYLSTGNEPVDAPAVRYRGIFINDECWGLGAWAAKTYEPDVGTLGPKTYARVFELLLRLRANSIWPGMHPCTTPFHQVEGNSDIADDYAIVVGSSHAEPMLRNNVGEWTAPKDQYNYLTNREQLLDYWEQRVKQRRSGESLWTLGMRGVHDSGIVGPETQEERIEVLESIFKAQRELLAEHLGEGDPTEAAQIFVPYKEVLKDYNAGLEVPDDVTIVWPDDNFGYVRRYATPEERERSGGLGVYYHMSYLGSPLSWLWFDSQSPALIWSEMMRTYEQGAKTLWVGNVGDIKAHELSTEFFLDLAWNADDTDPQAPMQFLHQVAARDFGVEHADAIVSIWKRHQHLAFQRRPEHLQWHLSLEPYQPTELNEAEMRRRLAAYEALETDVAQVSKAIPEAAQDAFYQLVEYPVKAAAAANERYFLVELARREHARGDQSAEASLAASQAAHQRIEQMTRRYNESVAGGKWDHILTAGGVAPGEWPRFQPDPFPPLGSQKDKIQQVLKSESPGSSSEVHVPSDARPGDFHEVDGVVSMHAGHFTGRADAGGGGWRSVEGLGRTGSAVTVLPSTLDIEPDTAPRLSYRFYVESGGKARVHVRLLPTHPIVPGNGLRLALALDEGKPQPVAVTKGFDRYTDEWKTRVLSNATEATLTLPEALEPGWHTLHLVAVDAGVVVDKIVVDLGGLQPSYSGPDETRIEKNGPQSHRFDFGNGAVEEGYQGVESNTRYAPARGYGFISGRLPKCSEAKASNALRGDACVSSEAFTFAVDVPEGNYHVTLLLGAPNHSGMSTIKAEARRLMQRSVETPASDPVEVTFTLNRRGPVIEGSNVVSLNEREKGPPMVAHWDEHLTIEFLGSPTAVMAMEIEPAPEATTVFIAGDSTVTDQRNEPWAGWGQMLPAFFQKGVAVANHAESGRALFSFQWEGRLEKILSTMKRGDYLFIQFGHNDQKDTREGSGPFTSYQRELREYIDAVRGRGGLPVLVTPMERRRWHNGQPGQTLTDYARAMKQVGDEKHVPVIDLHHMSLSFYTALGPEASKKAFVHYPPNTFPGQNTALNDDTHHSPYGAYELARAVVQGIREQVPELATKLRAGIPAFDPASPETPSEVAIPASPVFNIEKPEGS